MNYPQRMYSKTELGLLYFPDTTDEIGRASCRERV